MKLNGRYMVTGVAAAGLVAGALTVGGAALGSTRPGPISAISTSATPSSGPGTWCYRMSGMWAGQQPVMTAAADYLGLTVPQLRTQLMSGNSLADIAGARGKPASGLKDAIVAAMTSRINADGALTARQRAAVISQMESHLDTMINLNMGHMAGQRAGEGMGPHMTGAGSPMSGLLQ